MAVSLLSIECVASLRKVTIYWICHLRSLEMIGVDQEILNLERVEPLILGETSLDQSPMILRQRFFATGRHLDPRLALFESLFAINGRADGHLDRPLWDCAGFPWPPLPLVLTPEDV